MNICMLNQEAVRWAENSAMRDGIGARNTVKKVTGVKSVAIPSN